MLVAQRFDRQGVPTSGTLWRDDGVTAQAPVEDSATGRRVRPPGRARAVAAVPLERHVDGALLLLLLVLTVLIEVVFSAAAERGLWYDELWRAHYISVPLGHFWTEIRLANTPSAIGWLALERISGLIFGYSPLGLRLPELAMLPVLAGTTYLLVRRFTVPGAAFAAAALVTLGGKTLDLGTQLKPYTTEMVCALLMVGLWCSAAPLVGSTHRWVGRRAVAGAVSLFSVPAVFLLLPLAASDFLLTRGSWRRRLRAVAGAVPALVLCALHSLLFIRRQSFQRDEGSFWNSYFLAGRGVGGGLRFVGAQLIQIAGSVPPGADRSDVNLVTAPTDSTPFEVGVLAPAFLILFVLGARVLWRRYDGRVLLVGLVGTELVILAASAVRYWPFGATRTNAFLVPLLTLVAAVGLVDLLGHARRDRLLVLPAVAFCCVVLLLTGSVAVTASRFYDRRAGQRLSDGLPLATDTVRRQLRPDDLVIVVGRLARPGWIYSVDAREARPRDLPPLPTSATVFVDHGGDGRASEALRMRTAPPGRVLLFIFGAEAQAQRPELSELRRQGWCQQGGAQSLSAAGRLLTLQRCAASPR